MYTEYVFFCRIYAISVEKAKQKKKKGGAGNLESKFKYFSLVTGAQTRGFRETEGNFNNSIANRKNLSLFHTLRAFSSSRNRDRGLAQVVDDVPV